MKYKVNVVMKIAFLFMTTALAVAMVACQAATPAKTPVTLGGDGLDDMSFPDFVAGTDTAAAQTVTITGSHFKGTNLDYSASSSNKNVATAKAVGNVVTVTPKIAGTARVTVIAAATADDEEGTQSLSFTVTVTAPVQPPPPPANNPPEIRTVIGNVSLQVERTTTLTLSHYYVDREGDELTYTAMSGTPAVATVTDPDAASMITITAVAEGTAMITVTASDSVEGNAPEPQMFTVTVTAKPVPPDPNERPTSSQIPDQTVTVVDDPTVSLTLSDYFHDADRDELTYTATSDKPAIATVTDPDENDMITVTAVTDGMAIITVTATDGKSEPVPESFDVTVLAENNKPPTVVPGTGRDVIVTVGGTPKTIDLAGYFTDPTDDQLDYAAESDMESRATVMVDGSMLTVTPVAAGTATITVTATDNMSNNDGEANAPASLELNVTVNPPGTNRAPLISEGFIPSSLHVGDTDRINLSDHFTDDDEGDTLTYGAVSSNPDVAMVSGPNDMSVITITAVAEGPATITVTATDNHGASVTARFGVSVTAVPNNPPTLTPDMTVPEVTLVLEDSPSWMRDVSGYFEDADEDELMYTAESSSNNATAMIPDGSSTLTITAVDTGDATITVTASDGNGGSVVLSIEVTVMPAPNNAPTLTSGRTVPQVSLVLEDDPSWERDVSGYFEDADGDSLTYAAESSEDMYATAMVGETSGVLTITAEAEGTATVTVTASDDNGGSVDLEIHVTVSPVPNMAPRLTAAGMALGSLKRQPNPGDAGPEDFNLVEYFVDPDGNDALLTYEVMQDKKKENATADDATATTSVIAVGGATWVPAGTAPDSITCPAAGAAAATDGTGATAVPNGKKLGDNVLRICYENAGTAEIQITAIDVGGKRSETVTVMFTVGANADPEAPTVTGSIAEDAIVNHTNTVADASATNMAKLKIGHARKVIDAEFNKYFLDDNLDHRLGDADMLTFEVKILGNLTGSRALVDNADHSEVTTALEGTTGTPATLIKEDDDRYGAIEPVMDPMSWDGNPKTKFTLSLTGRKGTHMSTTNLGHQTVAIIATDMYGRKFARTFLVGVNHDPIAMGAQAKNKKTLRDETKYQKLIVPAIVAGTPQPPTETVPLVQAVDPSIEGSGGYFSDGDGLGDLVDATPEAGSGAGCVIKRTGGTDGVATFTITEAATGVGLEIRAKKVGEKTVTISCTDSFGVESDESTLTVRVTGSVTGSRQ